MAKERKDHVEGTTPLNGQNDAVSQADRHLKGNARCKGPSRGSGRKRAIAKNFILRGKKNPCREGPSLHKVKRND